MSGLTSRLTQVLRRPGVLVGYVVFALAILVLAQLLWSFDYIFAGVLGLAIVLIVGAYLVIRPNTPRSKTWFFLATLVVLSLLTTVSWQIGNNRAADTNKPNYGVTATNG